MTVVNTREMVARARQRLQQKKKLDEQIEHDHAGLIQETRFPAAEIHTTSGVGKEIIKRISAKEIDPKRCRPWRYHNRDQGWLTSENCQDLIRSISKNGQQEPVLVRNITNLQQECDYEIIYGVRRWYATMQIAGQKLLAKVTNADDRMCSVLMHVENADSKDITDLERACSFAKQLNAGLFNNQAELVDALNITKGHVSRMINAATIFDNEWVNKLFPSKLDISLFQAYKLSAYLKDESMHKKLKAAALCMLERQKNGDMKFTVKERCSSLFNVAEESDKKNSNSNELFFVKKNPVVLSSVSNRKGLVFCIKKQAKLIDKDKIIEALKQQIEKFLHT